MLKRSPTQTSSPLARWHQGWWFLLAALPLVSTLYSPAHAHLSLIRQGQESAGTAGTGEEFGRALATGDFNGDGVEDLATGAPYEANDLGQNATHGAVVISYGSPAGLIPEGATWLTVGDLTDLSVGYGEALAAGDFNRDGYFDLAVGLPYRDVSGHPSAGEVWVHYGSASGLNPVPGLILTQPNARGAAENEDLFGNSLLTPSSSETA